MPLLRRACTTKKVRHCLSVSRRCPGIPVSTKVSNCLPTQFLDFVSIIMALIQGYEINYMVYVKTKFSTIVIHLP
jgi:hypothetical protein